MDTPGNFAVPGEPSGGLTQRRHSARAVKRKKFDDEVVESSLTKGTVKRGLFEGETGGVVIPDVTSATPPPERKKPAKPVKSKSKKSKVSQAVRQMGRWKPQDDLALVTAVQQTCDVEAVHRGLKFSCRFTLEEVRERWYNLLYTPNISRTALQAIRNLHPDIRAAVEAKTLYSRQEEALLGSVTSTSTPSLETFEQLLRLQPDVWFRARTPRSLLAHWQLLKQYHLLPDQAVQAAPKGDHILNFSDAEDSINDAELQGPRDEHLEKELEAGDRRQKREIRQLENELQRWQVLTEHITGVSQPEFDGQTLAVLRGRLVRYLMRSKEITVGRATKDSPVDVDLSLEGPATKVSRRQGVIRLRPTGHFHLANEGRRPVYVDGRPVLAGQRARLVNNSVLEVASLRFVFLINSELVKQETSKLS